MDAPMIAKLRLDTLVQMMVAPIQLMFALRFVEMEETVEITSVMMETQSAEMDVVHHVLLKLAFYALAVQLLQKIHVLKYAEMAKTLEPTIVTMETLKIMMDAVQHATMKPMDLPASMELQLQLLYAQRDVVIAETMDTINAKMETTLMEMDATMLALLKLAISAEVVLKLNLILAIKFVEMELT